MTPAKDYESLLKQFKAMRSLIKAQEGVQECLNKRIKELETELKMCDSKAVEELRDLVEKLTNELEGVL